jgi:HK97 family phage portal protein
MIEALFRRDRKSNLYRDDLAYLLLGGWQSKSGIAVTWKTALECVTVLACVRVIAEGLAQIPCKLYRERFDGGRDAATDHPLYDLLHRRPNEWQTSFEFREQIGLHLALARNAYVFINRQRDQITELLPIQPGQVSVKTGSKLGDITYTVNWQNGHQTEVPRANLWHLRGLSWDGIQGLDAVRLARESIGLSLAMEQHSAKVFANGTRVSGTLQTDQTLSKEKAREFHEQWQEMYAGLENTGTTPVLHSGFKWIQAAMNSDQAQLIESRRFEVERIAASFRVLPIMIGYTDKTATYASAEQMFLAHVVHTLGPWIERIEQSADVNLLTSAERKAGYYTHFVTAGLLRGAHKDRGEFYARALGSGGSPAWMTQDEVRDLEEMNPMGGIAAQLPIPTPKIRSGTDHAAP